MKYLFLLLMFFCSFVAAIPADEVTELNPYYSVRFQEACNNIKLKTAAHAHLRSKLPRTVTVEMHEGYILEEDHRNTTAICGLPYTLTDTVTGETRESEFKAKVKIIISGEKI